MIPDVKEAEEEGTRATVFLVWRRARATARAPVRYVKRAANSAASSAIEASSTAEAKVCHGGGEMYTSLTDAPGSDDEAEVSPTKLPVTMAVAIPQDDKVLVAGSARAAISLTQSPRRAHT